MIARGFLPTGAHTLSANHLPSFISAKELTVDPDIRISSFFPARPLLNRQCFDRRNGNV